MVIVFQILIGLALLVGLVAIFLSAQNWHWTQVVLVACILVAAAGVLYTTTKTAATHEKLRAGIPRLEKQLADLRERNRLLWQGTDSQTGIRQLEQRLKIVSRERGRVWRAVQPADPLDPQGQISVKVPRPTPHGLAPDTVVFAFETGQPNPASPADGPQYLGEFRVTAVQQDGAQLEPTQLLDEQSALRLQQSQGPWSLYETMPADRHKLFAGLSAEELRQLLPEPSVQEYLRHGQPATPDDDQQDVIGLDQDGQRVDLDQPAAVVQRVYDRPLRDYAYLCSELAAQRVLILAQIRAVTEDNQRRTQALRSAEKLSVFREHQKVLLAQDLADMQSDRTAIESHHDLLQRQLHNAQAQIEARLAGNVRLARQLTEIQRTWQQTIDASAPRPGGKP